ncbi:MAG: sigma-70 family RNA polymerase sigma factor [Opitutaceae bacterium]|nr:sigma-70 family RNA polymerase sigma factor [Opitutaceae bacterium]
MRFGAIWAGYRGRMQRASFVRHRHGEDWDGSGRSALTARTLEPEDGLPLADERAQLSALVVHAAAGDAIAQAELVRRYTRRIAGMIRSIVRESDSVEDVTQLVFIKMFRRLARLRDPGVFEPWLFTLVRNTAIDQVRRRRCRPTLVSMDDDLPEIADESQPGLCAEILTALDRALTRLHPIDRQLVSLVVAGETYRGIATRTGLSLPTVKVRLHRVRPFLRQWVGGVTDTRQRRDRDFRSAARVKLAA